MAEGGVPSTDQRNKREAQSSTYKSTTSKSVFPKPRDSSYDRRGPNISLELRPVSNTIKCPNRSGKTVTYHLSGPAKPHRTRRTLAGSERTTDNLLVSAKSNRRAASGNPISPMIQSDHYPHYGGNAEGDLAYVERLWAGIAPWAKVFARYLVSDQIRSKLEF